VTLGTVVGATVDVAPSVVGVDPFDGSAAHAAWFGRCVWSSAACHAVSRIGVGVWVCHCLSPVWSDWLGDEYAPPGHTYGRLAVARLGACEHGELGLLVARWSCPVRHGRGIGHENGGERQARDRSGRQT